MLYGDEKRRQMARSVLPSKKGRTAKRELTNIRRNKRRTARQELHLSLLEEDHGEFTERDLHQDPNGLMAYAVRDRRDADKIAHFMKWAIKVTDDDGHNDPRERMAFMMKVLPKSIIGWHARSHLEGLPEFDSNYVRHSELGIDYRAKRSHPFQHRFSKKETDLSGILSEIIKDKKAKVALEDLIVKKHVTCSWVMSYGAPTKTREDVRHPYHRFSKHLRGKGYVQVTLEAAPNVSSQLLVGPSSPPFVPTRTDGLPDFLEALKSSSEAPEMVPSKVWKAQTLNRQWFTHRDGEPPVRSTAKDIFVGHEMRKKRQNPDHHPEWLKTVTEFCEAWVRNNRDLYSTLVALR